MLLATIIYRIMLSYDCSEGKDTSPAGQSKKEAQYEHRKQFKGT